MSAAPAPEAPLSAAFLADIKPTGMRPDARLQQQLREFCESNAGAHPPGFAEWLAPHEHRPLWQLAVVGIALNQGIVMMTQGHSHDAEMLQCELELGRALLAPAPARVHAAPARVDAAAALVQAAPALVQAAAEPLCVAPAGRAADEAQSPYVYEGSSAEAAASNFERELQNLSLTECAGRCK